MELHITDYQVSAAELRAWLDTVPKDAVVTVMFSDFDDAVSLTARPDDSPGIGRDVVERADREQRDIELGDMKDMEP
jgi:hypothetical protein